MSFIISALCRDILRPMTRKRVNKFAQLQTAVWITIVLVALGPTATSGQGTALVSPEVHKDGTVTFRLQGPGAHDVEVPLAGLETPLKMTQGQGGIWSVTSAPLVSGTYWYSYLATAKRNSIH